MMNRCGRLLPRCRHAELSTSTSLRNAGREGNTAKTRWEKSLRQSSLLMTSQREQRSDKAHQPLTSKLSVWRGYEIVLRLSNIGQLSHGIPPIVCRYCPDLIAVPP